MESALMHENVWLQRQHYEEAEAYYYAVQAGTAGPGREPNSSQREEKSIQTRSSPQKENASDNGGRNALRNEISQARQEIQNALSQPGKGNQGAGGGGNPQVQKRLEELDKENKDFRKTVKNMQELIQRLESRVSALEKGGKGDAPAAAAQPAPAARPAAKDDDDDDDDDFDIFGDDEDEETAKIMEEKKKAALEQYAAKKSKKPAVIAKSSVILDCKPWDDETDMKEMERLVRTIEKDGLKWGTSKLVDLAYGIKKLTIICVVEDDKISVEDLREEIEEFENYVQSVDIAAFNKI